MNTRQKRTLERFTKFGWTHVRGDEPRVIKMMPGADIKVVVIPWDGTAVVETYVSPSNPKYDDLRNLLDDVPEPMRVEIPFYARRGGSLPLQLSVQSRVHVDGRVELLHVHVDYDPDDRLETGQNAPAYVIERYRDEIDRACRLEAGIRGTYDTK